jgi:hypothetical protein
MVFSRSISRSGSNDDSIIDENQRERKYLFISTDRFRSNDYEAPGLAAKCLGQARRPIEDLRSFPKGSALTRASGRPRTIGKSYHRLLRSPIARLILADILGGSCFCQFPAAAAFGFELRTGYRTSQFL